MKNKPLPHAWECDGRTATQPLSLSLQSKKVNLDPCQLAAMENYMLVPGKTTVIAALVGELVGRGKTVLLTSYAHSAVDTILVKLAGVGKQTLRS